MHACVVCHTPVSGNVDGVAVRVGQRVVVLCHAHADMAYTGAQALVRGAVRTAGSLLERKAPNLFRALDMVHAARQLMRPEARTEREDPTVVDAEVIR